MLINKPLHEWEWYQLSNVLSMIENYHSWHEISLSNEDELYVPSDFVKPHHTAIAQNILSFQEYLGYNDMLVTEIHLAQGVYHLSIIPDFTLMIGKDSGIAIEKSDKQRYFHFGDDEWTTLEFLEKEYQG